MANKKITIVGAGNVGASCALGLMRQNIADVVLLDVAANVVKGKILDINQAGCVENFKYSLTGGDDYSLSKDSTVVVITAGLARKPGMSRDDLLFRNTDIVKEVTEKIAMYSEDTIIIVVTNPMDVMAYVAYKTSGFSSKKVIGMGGVLDTARYKYFISQQLSVKSEDIEGMVVGAHGDSMVALTSKTKVRGKNLHELLSADKVKELVSKVKNAGAEIVSLLGSGSAYVAPASSISRMITAIINDEKVVLPCSAFLNGEYGFKNVYCGVPAIIGRGGVEKIIDIGLSKEEQSDFNHSCSSIIEQTNKILGK